MTPGYLRFNGLGEFSRYLGRCNDRVTPTVARATTDTAHGLLARTIPVTPVEFGPLRASGRVGSPIVVANTITAEVTFGGPAAGYAIYVHEKVFTKSGRKVRHTSPTKAKFLSDTASGSFPTMQAEMFARSLAIFREKV